MLQGRQLSCILDSVSLSVLEARGLSHESFTTDDPSVSLRECIGLAYNDFAEEIMRRFTSNVSELDAFRNRETEKTVIQSAWNPDCCPACGYELSELIGDGYYSHPTFLERCPKCLQKLRWKDEKLGKEAK